MEERTVIRCPKCDLNQFLCADERCRRCHTLLVFPAVEVEAAPEPEAEVLAPAAELTEHEELAAWTARRVLAMRRAQGLTQRELAARMNVPRTYISKIEGALAVPVLSSIEHFASAFEVTPFELLFEEMWPDMFMCQVERLVHNLTAEQMQQVLDVAKKSAQWHKVAA
jgi:transcriptional regulator with XRE-family HTH domain